jgi:hypothetical protein
MAESVLPVIGFGVKVSFQTSSEVLFTQVPDKISIFHLFGNDA